MSVLNQMLRDLEKRGAMPAVVAAAGMATVARPALAAPAPTIDARRRWIWAGVLAVATAFVAVHSWLSYQVQDARTARQPLGARQFAGLNETNGTVTTPVRTLPAAAATPVVHAPAPVASEPMRAMSGSEFAPGEATNAIVASPARAKSASPRVVATTAAPRAAPRPNPPPHAVEGANGGSDAAAPAVVVRASNGVAADVDRAADLIARGRSTEAMELLAQVLARQPTHAAARSSLAALLAESGRREQALHVLLAGSDQDPARFAAPAAQLQAELGDLAGALGTLARVPQARRSARDEALFAGIAQRAGDHMTAIPAYRRALSLPQPEGVWWVGLAVSLEAIGDGDEARNAYARASAETRLPADVRRYVNDRLTVLGGQVSRTDEARKASLVNVF